jgi:hypothetical protein
VISTFQQGVDGYSGCQDGHVNGGPSWVNWNAGGSSVITVGRYDAYSPRKILIRFDLSSVEAGELCKAASLRFYHTGTTGNQTANVTIVAYAIAAANGGWIEGTVNEAVQEGSPCWNQLAYGSPGTNWAGSAGLSTPGTDYIATSLGSVLCPDGSDGWRTIVFNAAGRAVIQSWFGVAAPAGLLIVPSSYASGALAHLRSRNYSATYAPILSVTHRAYQPDAGPVPCIVL